MDSTERRLQDAKLGAAIDDAMARLPSGYTVRVTLSRDDYTVRLMYGGRLRHVFDGSVLSQAIHDAVEWAENAGWE